MSNYAIIVVDAIIITVVVVCFGFLLILLFVGCVKVYEHHLLMERQRELQLRRQQISTFVNNRDLSNNQLLQSSKYVLVQNPGSNQSSLMIGEIID